MTEDSSNESEFPQLPTAMRGVSAQLDRAIRDIELVQTDVKSLLAWRWTITGGLGLISVFALAIVTFVAWSLWDDNGRLHDAERDIKSDAAAIDDLSKWRFKTDQRIESLEEKEIVRKNGR